MDPSAHILVVDDHREIRDALARYLARHDYRVEHRRQRGARASGAGEQAIDLVVLDIMMPREDGLLLVPPTARQGRAADHHADRHGRGDRPGRRAGDGCRRLRHQAVQPARAAGADPRRAAPRPQPAAAARATGSAAAALRPLDVRRRHGASWSARTASRCRSARASSCCSRALLAAPGHGADPRPAARSHPRARAPPSFDRSIDNQVSRLRKKIEADPRRPQLIKTHWGGGYSFTAEVAASHEAPAGRASLAGQLVLIVLAGAGRWPVLSLLDLRRRAPGGPARRQSRAGAGAHRGRWCGCWRRRRRRCTSASCERQQRRAASASAAARRKRGGRRRRWLARAAIRLARPARSVLLGGNGGRPVLADFAGRAARRAT